MINRAGGLALIGALALAAGTATQAQDAPTPAPAQATPPPQIAPPALAPVTPPPQATPSPDPSPTPTEAAQGSSRQYTWHGAWRDRARRGAASRPASRYARGASANPAAGAGGPVPAPTPAATPPLAESGAQPGLAAAPTASPTPRPRAQPTPTAALPSVATGPLWPWLAGAAVLVLLAAAWALKRLRRQQDEEFDAVDVDEPFVAGSEPSAEPEPFVEPESSDEPYTYLEDAPVAATPPAPILPPVAPAPLERSITPEPLHEVPAARARLGFEFRPVRAGVNLVTATAEAEITVTNTGEGPADDIRADMRLVSAHARQDEEIAAILAAPVARSGAAPFALGPGESREVRLTAALPREAIRVLTASDRPMFVPIAVVSIGTRDGAVQTGQAFAIGIERPGSGKLAPFWLDGPSRMYNSVAALAQGAAVER